MLLSKIQRAVSASHVHLLHYCSASNTRITSVVRSNEPSSQFRKINFPVNSSYVDDDKGKFAIDVQDNSNKFHSLNVIDQLSSLTLYQNHNTIDFKAYSNDTTPVLDKISVLKEVSLPFKSIDIINRLQINDFQEKCPIQDPRTSTNSPMKLHKGDLYWRRRRMRRHRLLRWRKRYKKLVLDRLQKRLNNREQKEKDDLKTAWQAFGLNDEPPPLSKNDLDSLSRKWEEQGILIGLKRDEMMNFRKIEGIRKATDEGK